jgi:hypothetical protein
VARASACPNARRRTTPRSSSTSTGGRDDAIGLTQLGRDPGGLGVGDEERAGVAPRLGPLSAAAREFLRELAGDLPPRVDGGLAHRELRGVFV